MSKLSGVDLHDFGTTYKAYTRELIEDIPLYGEGMHRFIPALASWYGARICEVPIVNIDRENGKSHYGISRTIRVFFDLITIRFLLKYMMRPLHFFGGIGMGGIGVGSPVAIWMVFEKLVRNVNVMDAHGPMMVFGAVSASSQGEVTRSFNGQRDVQLLDGRIDMGQPVSLMQSSGRLLQQGQRAAKLHVRGCLRFMAFPIAAQNDAQMLGGDFDLLHRLHPVALIVMVCHREQSVSLPQKSRLGAVIGNLSGRRFGGCRPGCHLLRADLAGQTE